MLVHWLCHEARSPAGQALVLISVTSWQLVPGGRPRKPLLLPPYAPGESARNTESCTWSCGATPSVTGFDAHLQKPPWRSNPYFGVSKLLC
jgi:hypothetical protein